MFWGTSSTDRVPDFESVGSGFESQVPRQGMKKTPVKASFSFLEYPKGVLPQYVNSFFSAYCWIISFPALKYLISGRE